MMQRRRRVYVPIAVLGCTAIMLAGCGGGDEMATPTPGMTPAPTTPAPGTTVSGDPNAPGIPGATGTPDANGAVGGPGVTASLPDLDGSFVRGGIGGGAGGGNMFTVRAVSPSTLTDDSVKAADQLPNGGFPTMPQANPNPSPTPPVTGPATPKAFTAAAIYVDGVVYNVTKGDSFPKDEPVFRLVGITAKAIELELVAGEFTSGGGSGIFLDKGDLVSLVNSSEQVTYKVKFLRPVEGAVSAVGF